MRALFALACIAGLTHAAFSAYWAAGGTWLLATAGQTMVEQFESMTWVLWIVAGIKALAAVIPLLAPDNPLIRGVSWVGGFVLVVWGGLSTVIALAVFAGVYIPKGGIDRAGMIGHAFLWDPLFVLWGVALLGALATSPPRRERSCRCVTTVLARRQPRLTRIAPFSAV
ncbi:DUF3995 domain-containing protein [Corynebacterium sanguinis]|uniref:DUF3995 domain-containing protein n=1 Tax=Corynebacterium sanguinis TaxID=2594913 RepID=UPI0021BDBDF7|nr:DUF3995 domain-containing protein [Corynebacterium sanguinis]